MLLVAVLFTLTPRGVFHHHHEEEACEQNDPHLESDPCHVTLHHADEAGLAHCSHTVHIEAEAEECYICQFLSHSAGYEYIIPSEEKTILPLFSVSTEITLYTCFCTSSVEAPFNKGPPAIKM
ncbi:MAG TPA: hypothetical protein VEC12_07920 [Bacteroidia bacterium]|nr:hypothetical protein [Bacteroidia bacterium]